MARNPAPAGTEPAALALAAIGNGGSELVPGWSRNYTQTPVRDDPAQRTSETAGYRAAPARAGVPAAQSDGSRAKWRSSGSRPGRAGPGYRTGQVPWLNSEPVPSGFWSPRLPEYLPAPEREFPPRPAPATPSRPRHCVRHGEARANPVAARNHSSQHALHCDADCGGINT